MSPRELLVDIRHWVCQACLGDCQPYEAEQDACVVECESTQSALKYLHYKQPTG